VKVSTYLDALECFRDLGVFLAENVSHVDGRSGLQPAFTLKINQSAQRKRALNGYAHVRTFPPLSAGSSVFPLPLSPPFFFSADFLSLEAAPFGIKLMAVTGKERPCKLPEREAPHTGGFAQTTNRIDGI